MEIPNIRFDLWPKSDFSDSDVKELENLISNVDTVKGGSSSGLRGIEIQTIIQFISIKVLEGFISKIGSDLYKVVKSGIAKVLSRPLKNINNDSENCGLLSFKTNIEKINLHIRFKYKNEDDIENLFNSLESGLNFLKKEILNKKIEEKEKSVVDFEFKKDNKTMVINYRVFKPEIETIGKIDKGTYIINK